MKLPWIFHRGHAKSPYLIDGRLADVLAAIQFMGAAARPEATIEKLASELERRTDTTTVEKWASVFREHREFFLVYSLPDDPTPKAALRLRYAYKRYDAYTGKEYSDAEYSVLDPTDPVQKVIRGRLTSKPLTPEQIQTLVNTAIGLRSTALEEHKASVWWVPLVAAILAFLGTIAGTWLSALLGAKK
jgi:hypothetical protein